MPASASASRRPCRRAGLHGEVLLALAFAEGEVALSVVIGQAASRQGG